MVRLKPESSAVVPQIGTQVLFDRNPLPVADLDVDGEVLRVNRAFERLFGQRSRHVIGRPVEEFLAEGDRPRLRRWLELGRIGREVHRKASSTNQRKEKLEIAVSLLPNWEKDEVCGFYAILRDLTNEHQLEEQLRQATKMEAIGHLAGGVAHDFNNLLTAILGYAEMLELGLKEQPRLRQQANEIRRAGERAGRLTRKLLAFSRKQDVQPAYLHLNSTLIELENMFRKLLGAKIRYETDFDVDLGLVWIDGLQLEQVLINLIVNARDALPDGGTVTIETGQRELTTIEAEEYPACEAGTYVSVQIVDNGCGMDEETQARIFEPFFTTKEPGKGTGLGLASVYGIVRQNGGFIRVESALGAGSTFEIGLPLVDDHNARLRPADPSGLVGAGAETILVVDDDEPVLHVMRHYLELNGYNVLTARNADEAVAVAEDTQQPIHLLLTDIVMPGRSGVELARLLREMRPEVRVLFHSGYPENDLTRQGGPKPGDGYLEKPVRQKVITQKVREILDKVTEPAG